MPGRASRSSITNLSTKWYVTSPPERGAFRRKAIAWILKYGGDRKGSAFQPLRSVQRGVGQRRAFGGAPSVRMWRALSAGGPAGGPDLAALRFEISLVLRSSRTSRSNSPMHRCQEPMTVIERSRHLLHPGSLRHWQRRGVSGLVKQGDAERADGGSVARSPV